MPTPATGVRSACASRVGAGNAVRADFQKGGNAGTGFDLGDRALSRSQHLTRQENAEHQRAHRSTQEAAAGQIQRFAICR